MPLVEEGLWNLVKKQYFLKLKSYKGFLSTLVVAQLFAMLFSLNGIGTSSMGTGIIEILASYYSADVIIIFTMFWGFVMAITMTTNTYRNEEFTFVSNRLSSILSSSLFLLAMSVVGGLTAFMAGFVLRDIFYYWSDTFYINYYGLLDAPFEMLIGVAAAILYIFLVSTLGLLIGMLVQQDKAFAIGILVVVISISAVGLIVSNGNGVSIWQFILGFFIKESSFPIFVLKVVCVSAVFIYCANFANHRLEVRK